jgi:hypothetical protein
MDSKKASTKGEVVRQDRPSAEFSRTMREWLARFTEHYRQPITEISADCYRIGLADLSPSELSAACREALLTSEFMPTVATIRNALQKMQVETDTFNGLLEYPEVSEAERKLTPEEEKYLEKMKQVCGVSSAPTPTPARVKPIQPVQSTRSLDDQKAELKRRGYLQ